VCVEVQRAFFEDRNPFFRFADVTRISGNILARLLKVTRSLMMSYLDLKKQAAPTRDRRGRQQT